jgi:small GTP-binding protein
MPRKRLANGRPAARSYLAAKIVLVGASGVGKTDLVHKLAYGSPKPEAARNVEHFCVLRVACRTLPDGTECEAVLWDPAGQPDYRLVQPLLLDDADLALVLFDPTGRDGPLAGLEYWLKSLTPRCGPPCRKILVGTRIDRGHPAVPREEIDNFCRQYQFEGGYIPTSAHTGEGCEELLGRIQEHLVWDPARGAVATTTYQRLEAWVLELQVNPAPKVLFTLAELRAQLEHAGPKADLTDEALQAAVGHLAKHGPVMVCRPPRGNASPS